MRVGIGFDVHPFDPGRALVIGGVTIPDAPGLAGHSDADVLCHAIADAILGGAALGDIGTHFPDSSPRWEGASSLEILGEVRDMVRDKGCVISSVDATVLLEGPRIALYRERMQRLIAAALGIGSDRVGVKATTTEGLGTVGRGEGAACMAVVLLDEL